MRLASKLTGLRIDIAGSGTRKAKENEEIVASEEQTVREEVKSENPELEEGMLNDK